MQHDLDILIVGGGLVGCSLAAALDGSGLRVGLVEAARPGTASPPSFDERNLALARATVQALTALDVWSRLGEPAESIRSVHVSSRGDFGSLRLDAADHDLDAFGAVLPARALGEALQARVAAIDGLLHLAPGRLSAALAVGDGVEVRIATDAGERLLRTRLLVGADGTASSVRDMAGIGTAEHDYAQTLFVSNLVAERTHGGCAFERFTEDGPVAVLPLPGGRLGSIWTVPADGADAVAALDDPAFRDALQARLGWRLGRLRRVGVRHPYRVVRVLAERLVGARTVLVGNAAQTLHPVAAQGFNLGLRDAATLAEMLRTAADPGSPDLLAAYAARRREDREQTIAFSHGLIGLFADLPAPLRTLRSLGFAALNLLPPLRDRLALAAMGYRGATPGLLRGIRP
ncbi:MAG TPA: 2-octaprenyl-6-methoxyphenyl hydroxylase [Xanthomonadaceae bacterium]|nr:2-octaprenyl-6-methoxyphenyl hydroxylase [Xanthomonadaceae bacterium]